MKFIKKIFVSTDGKDIAKVAEKYGAIIIKRPKHISNNAAQIEPAILHAIRYVEKVYKEKIDNIVKSGRELSPKQKNFMAKIAKKVDSARQLLAGVHKSPQKSPIFKKLTPKQQIIMAKMAKKIQDQGPNLRFQLVGQ